MQGERAAPSHGSRSQTTLTGRRVRRSADIRVGCCGTSQVTRGLELLMRSGFAGPQCRFSPHARPDCRWRRPARPTYTIYQLSVAPAAIATTIRTA